MKSEVKQQNYPLSFFIYSFWLLVLNNPIFYSLANGQSIPKIRFSAFLQPQSSLAREGEGKKKLVCSEQSLEILINRLLRDLPAYANRASQRARRLSRANDVFSYVLVAGRPEFQPLPLNPEEIAMDAGKNADEGVEQVFFTTLERQYTAGKPFELQQFHWLLLTKTKSGWQIVMMFSQVGSAVGSKNPPSPPRDSSNGVIAQGVKAWLRDCNAGSVRF